MSAPGTPSPNTTSLDLKVLPHDRLLNQLRDLIQRDHTLETVLIAYLGEVDRRRLYLEQACPSMFHYCVHVLHFAEGVAYKRIAVARAARRFPELLVALERADLHLTAASLLAPHLDRACVSEWLAAARHKTARETKEWIADHKPKPDVKTSVRKAPAPRAAAGNPLKSATARDPADPKTPKRTGAAEPPGAASAKASTPVAKSIAVAPTAAPQPAERGRHSSEPLGSARYCVRITIDAVVHEELEELRALLRHQIPDGDVARIVGRAVHVLLEQVRKKKRGASSAARGSKAARMPSPDSYSNAAGDAAKQPSRTIPVAIRRAVWERDEGRCSYLSREGRRCGTRNFLEFHHQVPWARCQEHRASNITLRCRAHNQHAAELDFGAEHMAGFRRAEGGPAARDSDQTARSCPQLDSNPVDIGIVDLSGDRRVPR